MDIYSPVETLVYGTSTHIAIGVVATEMEVDWVAAHTEGLTYEGQLDVGDASNDEVFTGTQGVHQDVRSELVTPDLLAKPALEAGLHHKFTCEIRGFITFYCTSTSHEISSASEYDVTHQQKQRGMEVFMMKKHLTMNFFQWHSGSLCKEAAEHYVTKPLWWFNLQEGLRSN